MSFIKNAIFRIRHILMNNKIVIKIYSIFPWNDIIFYVKRKIFLDKVMQRHDYIVNFKSNSIKFYLPYYNNDSIQKHIAQTRNFYEFDFLNHICTIQNGIVNQALQDGLVLDIGANIGNHTIFFLTKRARKVVSFEPVKDTFYILEKNIKINNFQNKVSLFNAGVGKTNGNAILKYYNSQNIGMSQLSPDPNGDIAIVSIDGLNIKEKIDFIKIDVEGFELDVIMGMTETLKRDKPLIMIEIRDYLFAEINKILQSIGYNHTTIDIDIYNIGNYLYIPQE